MPLCVAVFAPCGLLLPLFYLLLPLPLRPARVDNGSVIIEGETDPAAIEQQLGKMPYSMALRVDEETGTVSPIDATGKDVKDRAGHFIVPLSKPELLASIVAKSEASGVPCPPELIPAGPLEDKQQSSQPKSSQLPVAKMASGTTSASAPTGPHSGPSTAPSSPSARGAPPENPRFVRWRKWELFRNATMLK
jgi:hypothetical protein